MEPEIWTGKYTNTIWISSNRMLLPPSITLPHLLAFCHAQLWGLLTIIFLCPSQPASWTANNVLQFKTLPHRRVLPAMSVLHQPIDKLRIPTTPYTSRQNLLSTTAWSKSRSSLILSKTRFRLPRFVSSSFWWAHSSPMSSPRGHY
jgi:hypothetical protein